MTTTLLPSSDCILTLPEEITKALDIKSGDKLHMELKEGMLVVSKFSTVEVDFDDDTFMRLAEMAHNQDITLNQLINNSIRAKIVEVDL